jgi:hypothetical protein
LKVVTPLAYVYVFYCLRVLKQMKKVADPDEYPFRTKADYALIAYIVASIALVIVAFAL